MLMELLLKGNSDLPLKTVNSSHVTGAALARSWPSVLQSVPAMDRGFNKAKSMIF